MEVFAKIIAENLKSGERKIAATALLTFVALNEQKKPIEVPQVIGETIEEKKLHATYAPERATACEKKENEEEVRIWPSL